MCDFPAVHWIFFGETKSINSINIWNINTYLSCQKPTCKLLKWILTPPPPPPALFRQCLNLSSFSPLMVVSSFIWNWNVLVSHFLNIWLHFRFWLSLEQYKSGQYRINQYWNLFSGSMDLKKKKSFFSNESFNKIGDKTSFNYCYHDFLK